MDGLCTVDGIGRRLVGRKKNFRRYYICSGRDNYACSNTALMKQLAVPRVFESERKILGLPCGNVPPRFASCSSAAASFRR